MSSSIIPPLILYFKYFDNVLKTPNTLNYKNRRTINTANKTFLKNIAAFDKLSGATFDSYLYYDNCPLSHPSKKPVRVGPFVKFFTLSGFTYRDENLGNPPVLKATEIDGGKERYMKVREGCRRVVEEELGTEEEVRGLG